MNQNLNTQQSLISNQEEEEKEDIVFQLFSRVGGMGKYQKITLAFWSVCLYLCGGITLVIPYLLYQDPYECPDTLKDQTCNEYVCSLSPSQRQEFTPVPSMSTMANQFGDYRCTPESQTLDLAVLIMYLSTVLSYLFLTLFGDYLGHKKFIIVGLILTMVGMLTALFSLSLLMGAIGMLISCLGTQWIYTVSMLYITETVSEKYRQGYLVICQFFYGIGHLFNAGYFYFLLDWKLVFIYCYLLPATITLLGVIFFTIDSPICLIRRMKAKEVRKQFKWVAKINGISNFEMDQEEIEEVKKMEQTRKEEEKQVSKFSFLDLFRYRSLRMVTICLTILENSILFLFYAPTLMIADLQFNIFVNGLVIGASSLLSYPLCYYIIQKVKRKSMALGCFSIILALSIGLIFFWHPKTDQVPQPLSQNLGSLAAFFIISFLITMEYNFFEVYLLELYPTQIRLIGGSFVTFISGITISFSDFIIDGCTRAGFSVMIVFSLLSAFSICSSLMLPETLNKTPPDFIKELSQKMHEIGNSLTHKKSVKSA